MRPEQRGAHLKSWVDRRDQLGVGAQLRLIGGRDILRPFGGRTIGLVVQYMNPALDAINVETVDLSDVRSSVDLAADSDLPLAIGTKKRLNLGIIQRG